MEFALGTDLPLAVPSTLGNAVSGLMNHGELLLNTVDNKWPRSYGPATICLSHGKLLPGIFHAVPMLNDAHGSLLLGLERHTYYNCIFKPVSSLFGYLTE